ncbi:hypothetical protein TIFTF001_031422 [Ficus carica]|uniref:Transcription factor CBF/NF-Y/archaeal histone domain-containing protein n=1 Tax=Ficus carica TaxID=3494 RepID=A0AA88DUY1_FICCA|nr:hypothetical protein TIFTF001_031422 [Ficus carica]
MNRSSGGGGGGERGQNQYLIREQDQYMPIANVIRIMRRILPSYAKISDDAKETIQECVSEYISFITGEANDRCQREQRKTVTAEDVLWAMAKLGFDDYVEPLTVFLNRYRESENDRANLGRHDHFVRRGGGGFISSGSSGIAANIGIMDYGVGGVPNAGINNPIGGVGPYGPGFNFGPYPSPGMFDPMGRYFRDGSGGSGLGGGSST